MTEVIHGLVSGLMWSAILGTCLIAVAAVVTATLPASGRVRNTAAETNRARDASPNPVTLRMGRTVIFHVTRPGPRPSPSCPRPTRLTPGRVVRGAAGTTSI
jgi:hypothetical protein